MVLDNCIVNLIPIIRGLIKDQLDSSGRDVFVYEGDNQFVLCRDFIDSTTIDVCLNGESLPSQDWQFNNSKNKVEINIISSGLALNTGDTVIITYSFYKKYSDLEIRQYIQSSFAYFVEHRYKKCFYITDTDKIIAINNLIPNKRELYFICLISSILIDPMNIRVRTSEFTITANRDKSDREQIAEAFARYQRFLGEVDYLTKDYYRDL